MIFLVIDNNDIYHNNNIAKNKTTCFFHLNADVKIAGQSFACAVGLSFSKLLSKSLLEYIQNHKEDAVRPFNLTINITPEIPKIAKAEVLKCQIGDCRKQAFATGIYKPTNKEKRLCSSHASLYTKEKSVAKDWTVVYFVGTEKA